MTKMINRSIYWDLWQELSSGKQMVFLSGPRQVGKTTLAKNIAKTFKNKIYFNWDIPKDKRILINNPTFFENVSRVDSSMPLVILDEIHKYRQWKNYLKGLYDQFAEDYKFIVSGSGRLDIRVKGGDSLAGRYFQLHLFPFTVTELSARKRTFNEFFETPLEHFDINKKNSYKIWLKLFSMGGFPEPFVKGEKRFLTRWTANYIKQIVREDIVSFHDIKNTENMELLFALLPSRVGSPLSMNNLSEDIQVSFGSIKNWLKLFETFYLIFRIAPWTKKISRAILREKKLYLFNYTEIEEDGHKFENMVALELLRAVYNWNEYGYGRFTLHYIRNKEKEEVDFLIARNNKPILLVETKLSEDNPVKSLVKFQNILNIPAVQLINKEGVFKYIKNNKNKILIVTASEWLSSLP